MNQLIDPISNDTFWLTVDSMYQRLFLGLEIYFEVLLLR